MLPKLIPYLVSIVVIIGVVFYADKKISGVEYDYRKQAQELDRIHKEELGKIAAARDEEKAQLQANIEKLQQDLLRNQQDYEKKLKDIKDKKEKEAKELAAKAPNDLADDVSIATGFKVYKK